MGHAMLQGILLLQVLLLMDLDAVGEAVLQVGGHPIWIAG